MDFAPLTVLFLLSVACSTRPSDTEMIRLNDVHKRDVFLEISVARCHKMKPFSNERQPLLCQPHQIIKRHCAYYHLPDFFQGHCHTRHRQIIRRVDDYRTRRL